MVPSSWEARVFAPIMGPARYTTDNLVPTPIGEELTGWEIIPNRIIMVPNPGGSVLSFTEIPGSSNSAT
jgi:hypothetical protein